MPSVLTMYSGWKSFLIQLEEFFVYLFDLQGLFVSAANIVPQDELGEFYSID
ncbi:hypothetical protein [Marinomonas primoryensis]|jgi:hypothetical protein|uniref:hypothetical protein n=1 Tax=Marinomonas primoryensis TaxID=178399 RepID=UPI00370469F4